jgi:hemolysin activation/secretion protein
VNNRYNADTHAERLTASLSYDNFFQRGDSGTIGYTVAPEEVRDAEITSASYLFHIPDNNLSLLFSYLHSNSNVTALATTDVAGRGTTAGFRLLIPLGSTSSFSHSFSVGWDYKRYYELDTFLSTRQITSAPITYYPLNATYAASWTGDRSATNLTLGLEFGLASIGSNANQFSNKAYDAPPGFSILRATVSRQQNLPHDVQLYGSVTGQLSNDPLVSSEQIGAGGADSVRGYLEAETLADSGFYAQTELRSPSIAKYIGDPVRNWRFHLFYDAADVAQVQALPGTHSSYGLNSVGVGSRINLWGYLNGVLQDAQTLNRAPDTRPGTNRVLFRVYGEF